MRYQWVIPAAGLLLALTGVGGCSDDGSSSARLCGNWCDMFIEGYGDCVEDVGCWIEDVNDFEDDCVAECVEGLDDLDADDRKEAVDCLNCHLDEAGDSPDCDDYEYAEQECGSECNNDGAETYWDKWNPDLDTGCNDTDTGF